MQSNLDEYIVLAKQGDASSLLVLLKAFGWEEQGTFTHFLGKYERLLLFGRIDLRDKDTRRFLQLYIPERDTRKKLVPRYQDYQTLLQAQATADYLQQKASILEAEDIRQELGALFIESVYRYEKKDEAIDFTGYLYNSFRYHVYAFLRKKVFKFEWFHHPELYYLEEDIPDETALIEPQEAWFDRFYASELKREDLGIFWINGRCGSLFETLSVFERIVLRDHDFYGQTDGEIAKRYGYHINTIYKRRHIALAKLKKEKERLSSL